MGPTGKAGLRAKRGHEPQFPCAERAGVHGGLTWVAPFWPRRLRNAATEGDEPGRARTNVSRAPVLYCTRPLMTPTRSVSEVAKSLPRSRFGFVWNVLFLTTRGIFHPPRSGFLQWREIRVVSAEPRP
jgi:hypothetical protein